MFDFQKLEVYQKAKFFSKEMSSLIKNNKFDRVTSDQLRRASFSIMLNIAEGSSRFSNKDRRHFFIISRGSVFECVAILEYLFENKEIQELIHQKHYHLLDEISRMLFSLIKKLD